MSGQSRRASDTFITLRTPAALASRDTAMTQVLSVPSKGTTPTGRPRKLGRACCSTLAKKPSKSR